MPSIPKSSSMPTNSPAKLDAKLALSVSGSLKICLSFAMINFLTFLCFSLFTVVFQSVHLIYLKFLYLSIEKIE